MLALLLALCSTLSKEIGITATAMLLVYEFLIHKKVPPLHLPRITPAVYVYLKDTFNSGYT